MAKNIVLLFDGTANDVSSQRTNILRLYGILDKGTEQVVWYTTGLGTIGAEDAWSRHYRAALELWGKATGWLLDRQVKQAYTFLVRNYHNGRPLHWSHHRRRGPGPDLAEGERDRIFLFGFSRGAYSARVLAGFIHAVGLIHPDNLNLLDQAYAAYKAAGDVLRGDGEALTGKDFEVVRLFERILETDRPPIRCLGLFDTVASVIEWGSQGPRLRWHPFVTSNVSVQSVRHAVSVHERRTLYRNVCWSAAGEYWGNPFNRGGAQAQDIGEVWFPGVHCDVGGGYAEKESGLAKLPLDWMLTEVEAMGLRLDTMVRRKLVDGEGGKHVPPSAAAQRHDELKGAWWIPEYLPRFRRGSDGLAKSWLSLEVPKGRWRVIPEGAAVHRAVFEHAAARDNGAPPQNLPQAYTIIPGTAA